MNAFTPEVMLQLAIVPDYDRINLIRKLMRLESGLWSAEITEIINQYRHNNVVDQPNIAFEVHTMQTHK